MVLRGVHPIVILMLKQLNTYIGISCSFSLSLPLVASEDPELALFAVLQLTASELPGTLPAFSIPGFKQYTDHDMSPPPTLQPSFGAN